MSAREWLVVLCALAAIAWVNWYFFMAPRRAPGAAKREEGRDG